MAMDAKEKQTWMWVGLIFVVFLAAVSVVPPMGLYYNIQEYRETVEKNAAAAKELAQAQKKVKELPELRKRVQESQELIAYYERRLPDSPEAPELLEDLKRLALESGLRFTTLKRQETKDRGAYIEIPMSVSMLVDYHGLGDFINRIENADRFAKVDNLNIETNPDE